MTTENLFLILHKVRGEPAFDVAIRLQIAGEAGWIVPTSGHRAYPARWFALTSLEGDVGQGFFEGIMQELPVDLPDHYSINDTGAAKPPSRRPVRPATTLEDLGL